MKKEKLLFLLCDYFFGGRIGPVSPPVSPGSTGETPPPGLFAPVLCIIMISCCSSVVM